MNSATIFAPLEALVVPTFVVMLFMAYKRFSAGFAGRLKPSAFKLGESPEVPDDVRVVNRNFVNLFEMPVLFYVLCLALYVAQGITATLLVLAWVCVGLRALHSLIHVTCNKLPHRFTVYAASNSVLLDMWIVFVVEL